MAYGDQPYYLTPHSSDYSSAFSSWPKTRKVEKVFYTWAEAMHHAKAATDALDKPRIYRIGNQWCLTYTAENRVFTYNGSA